MGQFCCLKETAIGGIAKVIFSTKDKGEINAVADKFYTVIEGILPDEGFINGLSYPTVADLAVVIISRDTCLLVLPTRLQSLTLPLSFQSLPPTMNVPRQMVTWQRQSPICHHLDKDLEVFKQ